MSQEDQNKKFENRVKDQLIEKLGIDVTMDGGAHLGGILNIVSMLKNAPPEKRNIWVGLGKCGACDAQTSAFVGDNEKALLSPGMPGAVCHACKKPITFKLWKPPASAMKLTELDISVAMVLVHRPGQ